MLLRTELQAIAIALVTLMSAVSASAITLGGVEIARGERIHVELAVAEGEADPATRIPVTVVRGREDGPVVVVVTGVHGFEFAPILAASRLADRVTTETLRGTLIIVRPAHVSAFEQRSPYVNPHDRKNLNRAFPGRADGTQTERIAHVLSTEVIPLADFVFDVHSGDGAEWLDAFVGVYGGPLSTDFDTAFGVARSMGFPNIVRYAMNTQAQVDTRRSLNRQAVAQGVPTVLVEVGQNGRRDEADVAMIVRGLVSALSFLELLPESHRLTANSARLFDGTQSTPVNHSGVWYPQLPGGRFVREGELLGVVRDYAGRPVEEVTAPISGYALYGLAGPPVRKGESVMTIARPVPTLRETARP